MKKQTCLLILLSVIGLSAFADIMDIEDVSKESDAAIAENKSVQQSLAKEKAAAEHAQKAADEVRKVAQSSKETAIDEMKKSEAEIQSLTSDQTKIKDDIARMKKETAQSGKTLLENRQKLEKAKQELATLQQLRAETNKKMLEVAAETDKVTLELKQVEYGKAHAISEFQQVKEDTKKGSEHLDKLKEELTQKRAHAAIAAGTPVATVPAAQATATPPVPTTAPVPGGPVAAASVAATAPVQREISSTAGDLVLKKDCKVYDRVTANPQVIGLKANGSAVTRTDETRYWIGFSVSATQKGFVAKTCF